MRVREGFTIIELIIVLVIGSIMSGAALMGVRAALTRSQVQSAASVVAADLQMARQLAARQQKPVRISIDTINRAFRIRDMTTPSTVYSTRHFHAKGEYPVQRFSATDTSLLVYPNGLAAKAISVTVRASGEGRVISMTRAGQVRVRQP